MTRQACTTTDCRCPRCCARYWREVQAEYQALTDLARRSAEACEDDAARQDEQEWRQADDRAVA